MTYLTRGPVGTTGIGSKGHGGKAPTPVVYPYQDIAGGEGMSHLTRGPSKAGDRQQANASTEPTPVRAQIVDATGGDGMSRFPRVVPDFSTTPQALP